MMTLSSQQLSEAAGAPWLPTWREVWRLQREYEQGEAFAAGLQEEIDSGGFSDPPGLVCAVCGCTDEVACPGECYWVAPGLCSACVGPG